MTCTGPYTVTQADVDGREILNAVSATGTPPKGAAPTASTELTIPAQIQSGITVEKSADPTSYSDVGQRITFSFLVTNTGNTTLTGIALADSLVGLSTPACPVTTLAPDATTTCTASYLVTQGDLDAGRVDNTATVTATDPFGDTVTDDGATSLTADTTASLTLAKGPLTPTVTRAGEITTYQFVIANAGNVTVSNIALADSLAGVSEPECTPALSTPLAPGGTVRCTTQRTALQSDIDNGSIENTATVTGTDPRGAAIAPVTDGATITVDQQPAMTLSKTPSVTEYDAVGDVVDYTIVATNTGTVTLSNVFVSDPLAGMTNWQCDRTGPISLAPGETKTCTGRKTVTQADLDAGSIINTSRVNSQRPDGTAMPTITAGTVVDAQVSTGLTLTKSADRSRVAAAGDTVTYTFDAANTGTVTLNDVRIEDRLEGLSDLSCSPALGGSVAPGATMHCTATKVVTDTEMDLPTIDNSAAVTATAANGEQLAAQASATVIPIHQPKLTVTKSADVASFSAVDETITYTFVVANTGNAVVDDVRIEDPLLGLSALACDRPAPVTLAVGESMTCTATYATTQADLDTGSVANTATPAGTDRNGDPVTLEPGSASVPAVLSPKLTLVKTSPTTRISAVGERVLYVYTVTNDGNVTISNVIGYDLHPGLGTLTCSMQTPITLAPGDSLTCQAEYVVTQNDMNAHEVVNTAVTTGTLPDGTALTPEQQGSDTLTIPTDSRAQLSLNKTADTTEVSTIGEVMNYTILVTNTGNETVREINPVDSKAGVVIENCDRDLPATLQPGDTLSCSPTYAATPGDFDAGAITNTASIAGVTPFGESVPASDSVVVDTVQSPQVSIVKQADNTTVSAVGDQVTYTIVATNTGNVTINLLTVTDSLEGISALDCTRSLPTDLGVGETVTCTATYAVRQTDLDAGAILNTASVSGNPAGGGPLPATSETEVVDVQQTSAIDMVKTADVTTVDAVGDPIIYTLRITNRGNTTLRNVIPDDPMEGIVPIGCSPEPLSSLAPGETMTCTGRYLTTHADLEAGRVANTATGRADSPTGPVLDTDAANVTAIYAPAIALEKSVSGPDPWVAGDTLTYTFTVRNVGTMTATNIAVSDPLDGLSTPVCQAGTLEVGESTTCTATYTPTQADADRGRIDNTATATATEVTGQPYTPVSASAFTTTDLDGSMTLKKTADPATYSVPGETTTYTFTVRNTGLVSLAGISVSDDLAGLSALTCPENRTLAPNATLTCTATRTVTQVDLDAGSVTNTATVRAVDAHGHVVDPVTADAVATADQQPALALTKEPAVSSVDAVGDRVGYTFTIRNTGNVTVTDAVVNDEVAGVTLTGCSAASLAPGEEFTCTGNYTVTQADLDAGSILNTATASAGSPAGPVTSPEAGSAVSVDELPSITLDKTASTSVVAEPGDTVTYTLVATNTGNVTLSDVSIVDDKTGMSPMSCTQPATLAPGEKLQCTATYVVPQAEFDSGRIDNAARVTGTSPAGTAVEAGDTTSLTTQPRPALTRAKDGDRTLTYKAGEIVTYTFVVVNDGNVTLSDVTIEDRMAGLSPFVCDTRVIAPGAKATCTSTYAVSQADMDAGFVENTAAAIATTPAGAAHRTRHRRLLSRRRAGSQARTDEDRRPPGRRRCRREGDLHVHRPQHRQRHRQNRRGHRHQGGHVRTRLLAERARHPCARRDDHLHGHVLVDAGRPQRRQLLQRGDDHRARQPGQPHRAGHGDGDRRGRRSQRARAHQDPQPHHRRPRRRQHPLRAASRQSR